MALSWLYILAEYEIFRVSHGLQNTVETCRVEVMRPTSELHDRHGAELHRSAGRRSRAKRELRGVVLVSMVLVQPHVANIMFRHVAPCRGLSRRHDRLLRPH